MMLDDLVVLHLDDDTPVGDFVRQFHNAGDAPGLPWSVVRPIYELIGRGLIDQYRELHKHRRRFYFYDNRVFDRQNGFAYTPFKSWGELASIIGAIVGIETLDPDVVTTVFYGETSARLPFDVTDKMSNEIGRYPQLSRHHKPFELHPIDIYTRDEKLTFDELVLLHKHDPTPFGILARRFNCRKTNLRTIRETLRWAHIIQPLLKIHEWGLAEEYQFAHSNRLRFQVVDDVLYDHDYLTIEDDVITDGFYIYDSWKDLARKLGVWSGCPNLDADVVTTLYFGDECDELPFTVDDLRAQRLESEACDSSEAYTPKIQAFMHIPFVTDEENGIYAPPPERSTAC